MGRGISFIRVKLFHFFENRVALFVYLVDGLVNHLSLLAQGGVVQSLVLLDDLPNDIEHGILRHTVGGAVEPGDVVEDFNRLLISFAQKKPSRGLWNETHEGEASHSSYPEVDLENILLNFPHMLEIEASQHGGGSIKSCDEGGGQRFVGRGNKVQHGSETHGHLQMKEAHDEETDGLDSQALAIGNEESSYDVLG